MVGIPQRNIVFSSSLRMTKPLKNTGNLEQSMQVWFKLDKLAILLKPVSRSTITISGSIIQRIQKWLNTATTP